MEEEITVTFYSEKFTIPTPKNYLELLKKLSNVLEINLKDCRELDIYYNINNEKLNIKDQNSFLQFIYNEIKEIKIEMNKESKLYEDEKKEIEKKQDEKLSIKEIENIIEKKMSQLKKDIIEASGLKNNDHSNLNSYINEKCKNTIHNGITCSNCGKKPIIGIRYHCLNCSKYNLCEECEFKIGDDHPHNFLKMRHPVKTSNKDKRDKNVFTHKARTKKEKNSDFNNDDDDDNCFY